MKPTKAPRSRPEPVARQYHPRAAEQRHAATLHRRALGDGAHFEPTIFDHAIKNSGTYDADISRRAPSAKSAEDLFFDLALADLTRAAELFQPVFARTDGVDGWVSLEVSPLLAHDTNSTLAAARNLHQRRQAQPLHQDSRHRGRTARHRGGDLCRRSGQCHAALLSGAICCGGRSLPARRRAAHRGGAEPGSRLGRFALCQPLGRCGQWQGPRGADQSARHRSRPARLQGLSRVARFRALPACRQCRRSGPAPPLCQHRHQGPESLRHPLREGSRRALHRQHHAGGHPQRRRRPRRSRRDPRTGRRRLRDGSGQLRPAGIDIDALAGGSRTRVPRPSSSPGTT